MQQITGQWHENMAFWNAAIESLQFWAEDLDPITLGIASEHVYTHFFWTSTSHTLHQLSDEVLFGCFILTLNSAFHQQLSFADEGYESGSNEDLPTPLWKAPCIHHVSSMEHTSFNPIYSTPHWPLDQPHPNTQSSPVRPVCQYLSFNSDQNQDTSLVHMKTSSSRDIAPEPSDDEESSEDEDFQTVPLDQDQDTSLVHMETSSSRDTAPEPSDDEESSKDEDFQTVPLDDEHCTTEIIPERTFCIHENGLPNNVCSYPCPYGTNGTSLYIDSLDLSDISDLEDHFLTTSDD